MSHWLIAVLVLGCWWTAEHDQLDLHRAGGYVLLGLIIFRLIWGVFGSSTARFASFIRGPRAIGAYVGELIRGRKVRAVIGHNPLGGLSVVAMLILLTTDLTLGLFAVNVDGDQPGPLAKFLSFDQAQTVAAWHHWVFNALAALIGLHLLAIAFYAVVKRDNLVGPMITGAKSIEAAASPMTAAPFWRLAVSVVAAAGATWLIVHV